MMNTRLDAGFSGVIACLTACLACTSLQDLSSYSRGSPDDAAPPAFQPPARDDSDEPPPPEPDAGSSEPPVVEAQNPSDVPLMPPDGVAGADDCTASDEFSDPDSSSCYRLGGTTTAWLDARDFCQAWGGDLAKVESVEENDFLAERNDEDVWLGASDFEDEGNFRWIDGDDVAPGGPWATAQPDNFEGREDCLELRSQDDRWNDVPCTSPKLALCERALGSVAAP